MYDNDYLYDNDFEYDNEMGLDDNMVDVRGLGFDKLTAYGRPYITYTIHLDCYKEDGAPHGSAVCAEDMDPYELAGCCGLIDSDGTIFFDTDKQREAFKNKFVVCDGKIPNRLKFRSKTNNH